MTGLIVLGAILALLLAIALLRFGVEVEYSESGFFLSLHVGPVAVQFVPKPERPEKRKKQKKERPKEKKPAPRPENKRGGTLELVKKALPTVREMLSRLLRKLKIVDLTLHFLAGAEDPAKAAMSFGAVSAFAGMLVPLLENHFKIKDRDIRVDISFEEKKPLLYAHARISLAVWEAVYSVLALLPFIKFYLKQRKAVKEHGEASDRRTDGNDDDENQADGGRKHHRRAADQHT